MRFDNDVPWVKPLILAALVALPAHRQIAPQPTVQVQAVPQASGPAVPAVQRAIEQTPAANQTFPAITG